MHDYFASSTIGLILSWIFAVPAFLGLISATFAFLDKIEDLPKFLPTWVGLCFLIFSPFRYIAFILVLGAVYPVSSLSALQSVFCLEAWWMVPLIALAFGVLFAIGLWGPLLLAYLPVMKSPASGIRCAVCVFLAPLMALLGSALFSLLMPLAAMTTHWLPAEDLITATNGPAYCAFCLAPSTLARCPKYISETDGTTRDVMRSHVALYYLNDSEYGHFVKKMYPEIYAELTETN